MVKESASPHTNLPLPENRELRLTPLQGEDKTEGALVTCQETIIAEVTHCDTANTECFLPTESYSFSFLQFLQSHLKHNISSFRIHFTRWIFTTNSEVFYHQILSLKQPNQIQIMGGHIHEYWEHKTCIIIYLFTYIQQSDNNDF